MTYIFVQQIFKGICLTRKIVSLNKFSLRDIFKFTINNEPGLVDAMALHQTDDMA